MQVQVVIQKGVSAVNRDIATFSSDSQKNKFIDEAHVNSWLEQYKQKISKFGYRIVEYKVIGEN